MANVIKILNWIFLHSFGLFNVTRIGKSLSMFCIHLKNHYGRYLEHSHTYVVSQ